MHSYFIIPLIFYSLCTSVFTYFFIKYIITKIRLNKYLQKCFYLYSFVINDIKIRTAKEGIKMRSYFCPDGLFSIEDKLHDNQVKLSTKTFEETCCNLTELKLKLDRTNCSIEALALLCNSLI